MMDAFFKDTVIRLCLATLTYSSVSVNFKAATANMC